MRTIVPWFCVVHFDEYYGDLTMKIFISVSKKQAFFFFVYPYKALKQPILYIRMVVIGITVLVLL